MTIRQSLLLSLTFILTFTSAAILAVAAFVGVRGAEDLTRSVIEATETRLSEEVDRFLEEVERDVLVTLDWMRSNDLGPSDYEYLNRFFQPLIESTPQLSSVLIARSDGSEYSILQDPADPNKWQNRVLRPTDWGDQALLRYWDTRTGAADEQFGNLDYDPRARPYYRVAVTSDSGGVVSWTAPYIFFVTRDPGITGGAYWVTPGSTDTIVVAFNLLLLDLSSITSQASVSENGFAFALSTITTEESARLVGVPGSGTMLSTDEIRRRLLPDSSVVAKPDEVPALPAADRFEPAPLSRAVEMWSSEGRKTGAISYQIDGDRWWASFRAHDLGSHTMWIAVAAPETDFIGDLVALVRQVGLVALLAFVAAVLLATWLAHRFARPLEALAHSSAQITRLDLRSDLPIESRLKEIKGLAEQQERMRVALDSFTRYMPVEIVRRLMERGEAARIGGQRRVITILFTDIEGFTTIAESHSAEETTEHLTDYFELILDIIRHHRGEVNQLMGDGVVAYWGAPAANPDHASHAVRAILECKAQLDKLNPQWEAEGKPGLPTRFGMATGEVVVGNVGSPSRLAYVAVGDPANLASRIEGLNKFYGTRLLVAGDTRDRTGNEFEWRQVDGVRAKGKSKVVELYEPLGYSGAVSPERLTFRDGYEAALREYRSGKFADALRHLDDIAARNKDDESVRRLRRLSEEYVRASPPDGWDGVTDYYAK